MTVPFVDLKGQYLSIKNEIDGAVSRVISEGWFIGGKYVDAFEQQFAEQCGAKHVISCSNGTDSLYIIMKMLGIGVGDEVITAANGWISDADTITHTGARLVFADVHPEYYSIDENLLANKITKKTKAIIAVHLQGQACEMEALTALCKKHSIHLIEDCAQAHFSEYKGKRVGLFGVAAAFSFYPSKNLGAYGDAGCVITNDDTLAEKCRMFARQGTVRKHEHLLEGINSRMDTLQAAILSAKLPHVHQWIEKRIQLAQKYDQLLSGIPEVSIPKVRTLTRHTFHLYVIRCKDRSELIDFLKDKGVETSIHYPAALPNLPAYQYLNHNPSDFPVASRLQNEILSLPMYPELSEEQVKLVADSIRQFYSDRQK